MQSQNVTLNIRVLIQGYYAWWIGPGTMVAVIDPSGHPNLCDTLTVKLVDTSSTTYHVAFSSISTISTTGYGSFIFPDSVLGGTYVIQLVHRNALTVLSSHAVTFIDTVMFYDFTVLPFQFCESGISSSGYAMMCSGDLNQDGIIDSVDFNMWSVANIAFESGYVVEDVSGDNNVDVIDGSIIQNNMGAHSSYPNSCIAMDIVKPTKQNDLTIYPNPTGGLINISLDNIRCGNVDVFNVMGEKIYSEIIGPQPSDELQLILHAMPGIYFVKLNSVEKQWTGKIIVE